MGLSRNLSLILGGATACTYMVASFIPLWVRRTESNVMSLSDTVSQTVDRYGRRALLMISASGLSLCFILAAALLSTGTQGAAFGATAMVFIFQIFLGIGYLPIVSSIPRNVRIPLTYLYYTAMALPCRGRAVILICSPLCD